MGDEKQEMNGETSKGEENKERRGETRRGQKRRCNWRLGGTVIVTVITYRGKTRSGQKRRNRIGKEWRNKEVSAKILAHTVCNFHSPITEVLSICSL